MTKRDAKVQVIGMNDDGPAGLPAVLVRRVEEAELLFGGERHLAFFPESKAQKTVVKSNLKEVAQAIKDQVGRKRIVVLASGDPLFFGIGKYLASRLGADALEVTPAPSAMQLAFARAGESWEDAALVSVHGKPMENLDGPARDAAKLGIFTDEKNSPAAIATYLLGLGCGDFSSVICENLGGADEKVTRLAGLAELAKAPSGPLNVLILIRKEEGTAPAALDPKAVPVVGIPDGMFVYRQPKKGLITKVEVRVVSLARMALKPDNVVWDVGAGSGSVAVEAARLVGPMGRVFAIEKNREDFELIEENLRRFNVSDRVTAICGRAPEGIGGFDAPDAVFVGGSGGELGGILDLAKSRLKPSGRIVVNAITAENLAAATAWFKGSGLRWEMTMLNVSRSAPILDMTRFDALNPIFVVSGTAS
jgi:precorrin-6Y C5,15-methyltransferase (decarboxylating)